MIRKGRVYFKPPLVYCYAQRFLNFMVCSNQPEVEGPSRQRHQAAMLLWGRLAALLAICDDISCKTQDVHQCLTNKTVTGNMKNIYYRVEELFGHRLTGTACYFHSYRR